ncbi:FHA domain-containing protein [Paenibacillus sp. PR3]|uniref:FHA domain-containing protein n=1 Tax=Paenibacillus terricola TaxID=2763503 RepID=A0ABR8MNV5_9BACL|nr:DUF6382 domain-containing protein [Paenibacillus terricola]MBD3917260.1 FHA domain-containing protein [Paenibacillus terricola]
MGPFRVDFAMNRGHELILDREQPITREELDTMELQMLRSNQVPFLLPVEWIEIDGCVTFRYSIEGRRMLSHQLQLQAITMQQFYMCLLAITEAIDACKSYLLRPECCMLDEMYIFVGERWDDVSLLYVPFRNKEQAADELMAFLPLIMRLAAHVQQLDGDGLQSILRQVNDSRSVRPSLIRTLLQLIGGDSKEHLKAATADSSTNSRRERPIDWKTSNAAVPSSSVNKGDAKQQSPSVLSNESNQIYQSGDYSYGDEQAIVISQQQSESSYDQTVFGTQQPHELKLSTLEADDEQGAGSEQQSRNKWLMIGGSAIATALVWRYTYADHPSSGSLMLASGATLCVAAVLFFLLRRQRTNDILGQPKDQLSGAIQSGREGVSSELHYWPDSQLLERRNEHGEPNRVDSATIAEKRSANGYPVVTHGRGAESSASNVTSSTAAAVTVWMGGSAVDQSDRMTDRLKGQTRWEIERVLNGKREQYTLPIDQAEAAAFVIGRFSEKANVADDHPGISRVHVEFDRSGDGYNVKDMGSRNGTTLNGSPMIAYKSYKLNNGDTLQLAGNAGPVYTVRQVG